METQCRSGLFSSNQWSIDYFLSLGDLPKESQIHALNEASTDMETLAEYMANEIIDEEICYNYYTKMIHRRRVQLANSGDPTAKRTLASLYLNTNNRTEEDVELASKLLIYASEQGDIPSLMDLGWLFYRNDVIFKNVSLTKNIINYVSEWEKTLTGGDHSFGYSPHSTGGVASLLALIYIYIDDIFATINLVSIEAFAASWKYVIIGLYNDITGIFYYVFPFLASPQLQLNNAVINGQIFNTNYSPSFYWIMKKMINKSHNGDVDSDTIDNGASTAGLIYPMVLAFIAVCIMIKRRAQQQQQQQQRDTHPHVHN